MEVLYEPSSLIAERHNADVHGISGDFVSPHFLVKLQDAPIQFIYGLSPHGRAGIKAKTDGHTRGGIVDKVIVVKFIPHDSILSLLADIE